jgi:hypothetical protein
MTTFSDSEFNLDSLSNWGRDLVLAAAVRERFQPSKLMETWLLRQPVDVPDEAIQEAIDVSLSLGELSGGNAERPEGVELPVALRCQVLNSAGIAEVMGALALEIPRTQTEHRFADLVAGRIPDLKPMSRGDLLALEAAATWAQPLAGSAHVNPDDISRRLRNQEFVERVGGADLNLFVGREALLNALKHIWDMEDRPTVLVEGPGGIGKSIAIARFFQMLLDDSAAQTSPHAILYFDFDLPNMQRATAVNLAIEIVRQLALRWSTDPRLRAMLRALGGNSGGGSESIRNITDPSMESRDYRVRASPSQIVAEALGIFGGDSKLRPRLILFADSFERAEVLDEIVAINISRIVDALRDAGANVMVIYASRSYLSPGMLSNRGRISLQSVKRFTQNEAVDYLVGKARERGINLTRGMAARANKTINGWPLGLRIAISMLGNTNDDFKPDDWLNLIESGGRSVQATLYERLLSRIRDDNLRRLAKPGLLVRRISSEVIAKVLAEPCGLPPDAPHADELMAMAERDGQLFQRDSGDVGALWHRQDLREIMLPVLRVDIPEEVARNIHDAAVAYYTNQAGDIARAEELYHRLCRGDSRDQIEARWVQSAGQRLVGSLSELPAAAASIVRSLLGGGRSDSTSNVDELRGVALNRLSDKITDLSDIFARAGVPESLHSPLGDVYALLMMRQGRVEELLEEADRVFEIGSVPDLVEARIAIAVAGVAEGRKDFERALLYWNRALSQATNLRSLEQLTLHIAFARLLRKTSPSNSDRHGHVLDACRLLAHELQSVLSSPVIRLEVVAELSEVLQPVHQWQEQPRSIAQKALLSLFRGLRPMFPSAIESRDRIGELVTLLGIDPSAVNRPSDIDRLMHRFFNNTESDLHAKALSALRSEVDAGFASVVVRAHSERLDERANQLPDYVPEGELPADGSAKGDLPDVGAAYSKY